MVGLPKENYIGWFRGTHILRNHQMILSVIRLVGIHDVHHGWLWYLWSSIFGQAANIHLMAHGSKSRLCCCFGFLKLRSKKRIKSIAAMFRVLSRMHSPSMKKPWKLLCHYLALFDVGSPVHSIPGCIDFFFVRVRSLAQVLVWSFTKIVDKFLHRNLTQGSPQGSCTTPPKRAFTCEVCAYCLGSLSGTVCRLLLAT